HLFLISLLSILSLHDALPIYTIYQFPTHQTFFSSAGKLEIGQIPFVTNALKPVRNDALAYYREVAQRENLRIHTYETVFDIVKRSEEHTSELQSRFDLVCRLL